MTLISTAVIKAVVGALTFALGKGSSADGIGTLVTLTLPKAKLADAGADIGAVPVVLRNTIVPTEQYLEITRRHGSTCGAHAADSRLSYSLCNSPLDRVDGSMRDQEKAERRRGATGSEAVKQTRCKFCQTRLVAAGLLPASDAGAYAADYGTRALAETLARAFDEAHAEDETRDAAALLAAPASDADAASIAADADALAADAASEAPAPRAARATRSRGATRRRK